MRFRTLFLFLVLALTGLFALLNWQAFTAPTTLSLVFGTVEAPVGVIMLGVVLVLGAMCLAYLIYVQGTALGPYEGANVRVDGGLGLYSWSAGGRSTDADGIVQRVRRRLPGGLESNR